MLQSCCTLSKRLRFTVIPYEALSLCDMKLLSFRQLWVVSRELFAIYILIE